MPADIALMERLICFLKATEPASEMQFRDGFECPEPFKALHASFPSFEWFISRAEPPRILGIRNLVASSPFRLSDLKAQGLHTESIRYPIRPPIRGRVEHYLVAELLTPVQAKVFLCMHVMPQEWFVLDEHRITTISQTV